MSPDSVFWLGRAWYILPAISVNVRESLVQFQGDCIYTTINRNGKKFKAETNTSANNKINNRQATHNNNTHTLTARHKTRLSIASRNHFFARINSQTEFKSDASVYITEKIDPRATHLFGVKR